MRKNTEKSNFMQSMNIEIIRFIHLIITVSFLGFQIAGYYYLITGIKQHSIALLRYSLLNSLIIDLVSVLIISGIFLSCNFLVVHGPELSFSITWIKAACISLGIVTCLFLINMVIKTINFQQVSKNTYRKFKYCRLLQVNYGIIILLLIVIMHDAVMKSTIMEMIR